MGSAADANFEKKPDAVQETPRNNNLTPPELQGPQGLTKNGTDNKPGVVKDGHLVFAKLDGYDKDEKGLPKGARDDAKDGAKGGAKDGGKDARDGKKDGSDKTDPNADKKAIESYSKTLQRSGYDEADAKRLAKQTYDNFSKLEKLDQQDGTDTHLKGTPAEQMRRLDKAAQDILDKRGVTVDEKGQRRLADGQLDHQTDSNRRSGVRDMAARYADPKEFVVQGGHNACALESMQKQLIQGGDPAALGEAVASMMNTGKAQITDRNGNVRNVAVDSRSWAPDAESGRDFEKSFGAKDVRGMFGHASDALIGQVMADRKAERQGLPSSAKGLDKATYKYMAAHVDSVDPTAHTRSGEGLLAKGEDGKYHIETYKGEDGKLHQVDSPGATLWDVVDTNRAMGGANGAVFAHRNFAGGDKPPAGEGYPPDLRVTTFGSDAELAQKLKDFESKNGQSAQLLVDAPYLPRGGAAGHGLHVLNLSMNADGKTYDIDNNWSGGQDLSKVGYAAIDKATNPNNWQEDNRPGVDTIINPGSGRAPNETDADFKSRREREQENDKKHREQEEERKKQEEKARELEKERARKEKERQKEEEEQAKLKKEADARDARYYEQAQAELDQALQQWNFYQRDLRSIAA